MAETSRSVEIETLKQLYTLIVQSGCTCKKKIPEGNAVSDNSWCNKTLGAIQMLTHRCFVPF